MMNLNSGWALTLGELLRMDHVEMRASDSSAGQIEVIYVDLYELGIGNGPILTLNSEHPLSVLYGNLKRDLASFSVDELQKIKNLVAENDCIFLRGAIHYTGYARVGELLDFLIENPKDPNRQAKVDEQARLWNQADQGPRPPTENMEEFAGPSWLIPCREWD